MICAAIGLLLSFLGTAILLVDTIIGIAKPKPHYVLRYGGPKPELEMKLEPLKDWGYKQVKVTKHEIKLITALTLISVGFFLQLVDYMCE